LSTERVAVLTIYSTVWCGYCTRLKRQLDRQGVAYTDVDIEQDAAAEAFVKEVNAGNAVVPTVVFPDGSAMTNPTFKQVEEKLSPAA
jgi:mycoredoxin